MTRYARLMRAARTSIVVDALVAFGWERAPAARYLGLQRTYFTRLVAQARAAGAEIPPGRPGGRRRGVLPNLSVKGLEPWTSTRT